MTPMILRAGLAALLASTALPVLAQGTPGTQPETASPPTADQAPVGQPEAPATETPPAAPESGSGAVTAPPPATEGVSPGTSPDTATPPSAEGAPVGQPEAPSTVQPTPEPPPTPDEAEPGEPAPGGPEVEGTGRAEAPPAPQPAERAAAAQPEIGADWPFWGGDAQATRYSPLGQITPDNVRTLERAFVYRTGDMPQGDAKNKYAAETTPLKIGNQLVMCSAKNILISIDAATGQENWRHDPEVSNDAIPYSASCRGVSVYTAPQLAEDAACKTRIIEGTIDARLIAVDLMTGQPCADFGEAAQVDLWTGIGEKVPGWYAVTAPPAIVRGVLVTGAQVKDGQAENAPSGVIRGFDAVTGEFLWAWDLGNPGNYGQPAEGETYTRGTPNMWTTATGDEDLGLVYLPLGNSSVDYYGSNRSELENQWATSLVALNVQTGEPVWSFQTVRHDTWDYDLGSQATLLDYQGTPAILLPSKQGDIYILDRATGEPLTPVGEIEAPTEGSAEPEFHSATQPISEWHTLRKDDLVESDMWGFTPIDQLWCRIQFRRAHYQGFFTPPSADRPWIQYPGYNGGSDWGSVAVDTERGILVANYNDVPNYNQLIPREEADRRGLRPINEVPPGEGSANTDEGHAEGAGDPQTGSPYAINVNAGWRNAGTGVPCTKPPYGGIRAVDMATGKTLWDTPIGTARRNGPFGIPSYLPFQIGTPNNGGAVLTAGGLIFIGAATDNLFRAIDIETGETLWSDVLPAGGQANPISYEVDGQQYVLIAATGHHFMETPVGDYIVAYKLPQ